VCAKGSVSGYREKILGQDLPSCVHVDVVYSSLRIESAGSTYVCYTIIPMSSLLAALHLWPRLIYTDLHIRMYTSRPDQ
jgi:hypothetical protein